jgi:hypothetical protein
MIVDRAVSGALGCVTVNFSMLETYIAVLIWGLISPEDSLVGQMVTAQLSFKRSLDLLDALFRYKIKDAVKVARLEEMLKEAQAAEEARNRIVHSMWMFSQPWTDLRRVKLATKRGKGLSEQNEEGTAANIMAVAGEIEKTAKACSSFIMELCTAGILPFQVEPASGKSGAPR